MKSELLEALAQILVIASLLLYRIGLLDLSYYLTIMSAVVALLAALIVARYGGKVAKTLKKAFRPPLLMVKTIKGEALIVERGCKICRHLKRGEIEKMLMEGVAYKQIVDAFGGEFSIASLSRHLRLHMPRLVLEPEKLNQLYQEHRIKQIDLTDELFKLIGKLDELYRKLERIDEKFFAEKPKVSPHAFVESVTERRNLLAQMRETLMLIEEMKGEIKTEKDLSELLQKLRGA
ncbi:MAG: hypothetical protein QXU87_04050 [Candidatus Caldarchaeum sp.]